MKFHLSLLLFLLLAPQLSAKDAPPTDAKSTELRAAFRKLLDRPLIPLEPKIKGTSQLPGDLLEERLTISTEKKPNGDIERVPTILIRPEKVSGRLPVVIVLHGTGGDKEGQKNWCVDLAKRGIIGVAIDARYHGERAGRAKGAEAYNAAIARAWRTKPGEYQEHPFYFDTCWDLWRLIDYLVERPDVDPTRIGMIGFSMGGIQTWLAAAVDERVKVAVPAIAVQSFKWSLENEQWQGRAKSIGTAHAAAAQDLGEPAVNGRVCRELWTKVIPGILNEFDCPQMLPLFVGRPLLIVGGELDANCPIGGARVAIASAEKAFREANCSDLLKVDIAEKVGHSVTGKQKEMAMEWLTKWLAVQ